MTKQFLIVNLILILALMMITARQILVLGQAEPPEKQNQLKVGNPAPLFELKSPDGKQTTDLKSFRGKQPVVLIISSYT